MAPQPTTPQKTKPSDGTKNTQNISQAPQKQNAPNARLYELDSAQNARLYELDKNKDYLDNPPKEVPESTLRKNS